MSKNRNENGNDRKEMNREDRLRKEGESGQEESNDREKKEDDSNTYPGIGDSMHDIEFIVGFTSGGAPYGTKRDRDSFLDSDK